MNGNEIKKLLYKNKPIAKLKGVFKDGGSRSYIAKIDNIYIEFFVPIKEINLDRDVFKDEMESQLLIRYLDLERTTKLNDFLNNLKINEKN